MSADATVVQIQRLGTSVAGTPDPLARLREEFAAQHCVRLPGFLEPELLARVLGELDRAEFVDRVHEDIGSNLELCMCPNVLNVWLHLLVNRDSVFRTVQGITACGPIGCFTGRVYRVLPNAGHHDAWHSDLVDHRLVSLSLNLSPVPFQGGALQIRERVTGRIVHEVSNTGPGDALLFRIAPALEHRITDMEGAVPKTAFAGWFSSEPRGLTLFQKSA